MTFEGRFGQVVVEERVVFQLGEFEFVRLRKLESFLQELGRLPVCLVSEPKGSH